MSDWIYNHIELVVVCFIVTIFGLLLSPIAVICWMENAGQFQLIVYGKDGEVVSTQVVEGYTYTDNGVRCYTEDGSRISVSHGAFKIKAVTEE